MSFDLVIRNGLVVSHERSTTTDLGVADGRVIAMGQGIDYGVEEVDASGLVVIPGMVDAHVHLREPGMTQKEDFATGTAAAAAGGVTTVIDMPNTIPAVATAEIFKEKIGLVAPKAYVDFGLYGLLGQSNTDEIAPMAALGALGLKLFMGQTTGDNPCPDDGAILRGLRAARDCGLVVGVHAENDAVLRMLAKELEAAGRTDPIAHLESRPSFVEQEAVARILILARATGTQVHIHHLSSATGLETFRQARATGQDISAEVLVAHLLLDDSAYETYGNLIKLNPPIRPRSDVDAMWRGLLSGDVEVLATDHAPHTCDEQHQENVWKAPGGFIGLETMLPLMLTEVAKGKITLERLVHVASFAPAKIWKIHDRKGHLGVGADADFNLLDPSRHGVIDNLTLHSRHALSPYHGWETTGAVLATYLRGRLIAKDGAIVGEPSGRFVTSMHHRGLHANGAVL